MNKRTASVNSTFVVERSFPAVTNAVVLETKTRVFPACTARKSQSLSTCVFLVVTIPSTETIFATFAGPKASNSLLPSNSHRVATFSTTSVSNINSTSGGQELASHSHLRYVYPFFCTCLLHDPNPNPNTNHNPNPNTLTP